MNNSGLQKTNQGLSIQAIKSDAFNALLPTGKKFDPSEYLSIQSNITPQTALNSPQISSLNKTNEKDLINAIRMALTVVNEMFNLPKDKKLSVVQIHYLANYLKKEYWKFKFDEFIYIFSQGMTGKLGKNYARLDVEVISGWFKIYDEQFFWQQRELQGYNQAANFKQIEKKNPAEVIPMPDHIKKEFDKLSENLSKIPETDAIPKPTIKEKIKLQEQRTDQELIKLLPSLTLPELKELLNELVLNDNERQAEIIRNYISDLLNDLKW